MVWKMSESMVLTCKHVTGVMTEYTNGMIVVIGGGSRGGIDWNEAWCFSKKGELIGYWEDEV